MNKRIASLFLCLVMVFSLLTVAVPAMAAPSDPLCTFTVEADKTSANPGDEITFTLYLQQKSTIVGYGLFFDVQSGLNYVENSGIAPSDLNTTMGFLAEWEPGNNLQLMNSHPEGNDFSGTEKIKQFSIKCTVADDAVIGSTLTVALKDVEVGGGSTLSYAMLTNEQISVIPATITVTAAPKPATGISLNKTSTKIYTGSTEKLVATVEPADSTDTKTWESNKPSVASVDSDGNVNAVAPGTAIITVKAGSVSASCTVTVEDAPCAHTNIKHHAAKESTCTVRGNDAYDECEDCHKIFTSDGEIPFLGLKEHQGGTADCQHKAECSVCHNPYGNLGDHNYTSKTKNAETLKTAGTCNDEAVYYYSCSVCGRVEHSDSHTFKGDKNPSNHTGGTLTLVSTPATCTASGIKAHYECACGEWFWDSTANLLISDHSDVIEPATGHDYSADWKSDSSKHWHECSKCEDHKDEASHIPGAAATETQNQVCTECGHIITPALGHTLTLVATPATCTASGIKAHYECACGEWFWDSTANLLISDHADVIEPATGHDYSADWKSDSSKHWHECSKCEDHKDEASHIPGAAATETQNQVCTECGHIITPALGHDLVLVPAVSATHTENGTIEHYKCRVCEKMFADATGTVELSSADIVTLATGHEYEWKIDKEASATESGLKHEECKICGDKKPAVEIPATGTSKSPKTGENIMLLIALFFVSAGAAAGTVVYSRKRKSEK